MTLSARHRLHEFTEDMDFGARRVLEVAGPAFGPIWWDLDKGTGHTCVAGTVNGHPLLRFYKTVGEVTYATVPIDEQNSQVNRNGRVSNWSPAGQILLDDPKPDVGVQDAKVQKALAFLNQVFRHYEPVWIRMGTTWPVALLRQRAGNPVHWAFVQVPTYYPDTQRAVVDLCLTTEALKAAMPSADRRSAPPAF